MQLLDGMVHGEILAELDASAAELLHRGVGFGKDVCEAGRVEDCPGGAEVVMLDFHGWT